MTKDTKRALMILFMVVATELIGFGLIIPILPQLTEMFSVSPIQVGFLLAAYSIAQFIAAPILGMLSDVYGRKPVLVLSKLGTCFAYIVLAFSKTYHWFLVARLLDGFTGGNISTARAYVADVTSAEDRPKGMAVIGISFGVGFILGPALGGFLYRFEGEHFVPALVAGALSFISFLVTLFYLKEPIVRQSRSQNQLKAFWEILKSPQIQFVCLLQLIYMMAFAGFETTFSLFTYRMFGYSPEENSWLFVYSGLVALLIQGTITRRSSKRLAFMTLVGIAITAISFSVLSVMTHFVGLLLILAFFSIGIGLVQAYLPSLLSLLVRQHSDGKVMGLYESLGSLGRILGPLFAYLAIFSSIRGLYEVYAIVLSLVGGCVMMILICRPNFLGVVSFFGEIEETQS